MRFAVYLPAAESIRMEMACEAEAGLPRGCV